MKIALISDAWSPQINGVVRTWQMVCSELNRLGHDVEVIHPALFRSLPCPTYPEIRLAIAGKRVQQRLDAMRPDAIHIATEGPLGLAARAYCLRRGVAFTTSFHTKFAEYIHQRFALPVRCGYAYLRWFHRPARHMLVATPSLQVDLAQKGFQNALLWTRGVDTTLFHPAKRAELPYSRPILLYVGRIAVEKNLETFLSMPIQGSKLIVGDGPQRQQLEAAYPNAVFLGTQQGEALARSYASADAFVFPSRTDTFGLVLLEALASGTPVAAYPVTGPIDVIRDVRAGILDADLSAATGKALTLNRQDCRAYAQGFSWHRCAQMLLEALVPIGQSDRE